MSRSNDLSPLAARVGLLVVLLAAGLLRGYGLAEPFGAKVEGWTGAFYATMARNMLARGTLTPLLNPSPDDPHPVPYVNHPPGVPWLVATSFLVCGEHEWAARLPFLAASLLSILYAFRLGKQLGGNSSGLFAAATLATAPAAVVYGSQVEVVGSWLLLASLGLVHAYMAACDRPTTSAYLRVAGWTLLTLFTDWPGLMLVAVLMGHHGFRHADRRRETVAWAGGTAAAFCLLLAWLLTRDPRFGIDHLAAKVYQRSLQLRTDSVGTSDGRGFTWLDLLARYVWLHWKLYGMAMIAMTGGWVVAATRSRFRGQTIPALFWAFAGVFYLLGAQGHYQHNFWSHPIAAAYTTSAAAVVAALRLRPAHVLWAAGLLASANLSLVNDYRHDIIPARSGDPRANVHHRVLALANRVPPTDIVAIDDQTQWPSLPFYLPRDFVTLKAGRSIDDLLLRPADSIQPWQRYLVTHKLLPPGVDEGRLVAASRTTPRWYLTRSPSALPGLRETGRSGNWRLYEITPQAAVAAIAAASLPMDPASVPESVSESEAATSASPKPLAPPFGFLDAFQMLSILALLAIAASVPVLDRTVTSAISRRCDRFTQTPWAGPVLCGVVAVAFAVLLTGLSFVPVPVVHDEFGYLLTADTFAHGRAANPTHPFWQHFETQHVVHQPAYQAKYPPAQGLFLAFGRLGLGHPIAGVWLSLGSACAAVCWALRGVLPGRWSLLGGLLAALHPWIAYRWGNTYWGGAVAMLGGALLFGGVVRLLRAPRPAAAFWTALGLAILANSRPFEGAVIALPLTAAVLLSMLRDSDLWRGRIAAVVVTGAAVLLPTAILMGAYNYRLTGSVLKLPYVHHEQLYAVAPSFLWQPLRPEPVYRQESLRRVHAEWEVYSYAEQRRSLGDFAQWFLWKMHNLWGFFVGTTFGLTLFALPLAFRTPAVRLALSAVGLLLLAFVSHTYMQPHYAAPATVLVIALVVQSLRALRTWRVGEWQVGRFLVHGVLLIQFSAVIPFLICYTSYLERFTTTTGLALAFRSRNVSEPADYLIASAVSRDRLRRFFLHRGGEHLVLVKYEAGHDPLFEWVFNPADIDASPVVWAHDMGAERNAALCRYYADRKVWRLTLSGNLPELQALNRGESEVWPIDEQFMTSN
jgi:hypothetical protein